MQPSNHSRREAAWEVSQQGGKRKCDKKGETSLMASVGYLESARPETQAISFSIYELIYSPSYLHFVVVVLFFKPAWVDFCHVEPKWFCLRLTIKPKWENDLASATWLFRRTENRFQMFCLQYYKNFMFCKLILFLLNHEKSSMWCPRETTFGGRYLDLKENGGC